jgi:hypothetical protein
MSARFGFLALTRFFFISKSKLLVMNLKFVKWVVNKKQTKSGDFSIMAEFTDDHGKKYEWLPKTEDLEKLIGAIKSSSELNKLRKKFEESFNDKAHSLR